VAFGTAVVHVQPPSSQGVLLAMALRWLHGNGLDRAMLDEHTAIELLGAVFEHRAAAGSGGDLLAIELDVDRQQASGRSGARAYLHTAGVAVADRDGLVVSSLVSVFDDFGSGVFVPELGITLNNRADGFTVAPNDAGPGRRPVHTLAPVVVEAPDRTLALATPGADGQVQTLLQVLLADLSDDTDLPTAIARPRWRSQDGALLIEEGHGAAAELAARGHDVQQRSDGDDLFGSVVAAASSGDGTPTATGDWRRSTWAGAL
jgi:gamma-glutamyltranspeptidase/glutathione hydrolase